MRRTMPSSSYQETERLILEIRKRPTIWDSKAEDYKNKTKKGDAWAEVCRALTPQYDDISDTQKELILHDAQSRWKSIRDSNHRCQKKIKQVKRKSGSEGGHVRKYLFADHLTFLQTKRVKREADGSVDETYSDDQSVKSNEEEEKEEEQERVATTTSHSLTPLLPVHVPAPASSSMQYNNNPTKTGHQRTTRTLEEKMITFMDRCEEKDEDKDFFNSLLSSVRSLTEDQKLLFRSEVITALRRIKSRGYESDRPPGPSGNKLSGYPPHDPPYDNGQT